MTIQSSQFIPTADNYRRLGCARTLDKHNLIHEYRYYPVSVRYVRCTSLESIRNYFGDSSPPLLLFSQMN